MQYPMIYVVARQLLPLLICHLQLLLQLLQLQLPAWLWLQQGHQGHLKATLTTYAS